MKRIHPAFKNFILNDALMKWDQFLKEENPESGIEAGTCFSTSNAFCSIFDNDLGIPCKVALVETTIGNAKARELFNKKINERKFGEFWTDMSEFNKTKPKEKLTPNDPVVIGMGHGDDVHNFHFIMNLYQQNEAVDLTLRHIQRPQWGISCNNYWAKYITEGWYEARAKGDRNFFISPEIMSKSGCVLINATKKTSATVHLNADEYTRNIIKLRDYIGEQIQKRNIPVFMR